jgi:hypothetical protein
MSSLRIVLSCITILCKSEGCNAKLAGSDELMTNWSRQIIVRVKDPLIKRRILKCTKLLKESEYTHVRVNEDLTKRRNAIAYKARQLKKADRVRYLYLDCFS